MGFSKLAILAIALILSLVTAKDQKMDDRFILHSSVRNATFKHWKAVGSAIFLEDKTVLAPEIKGSTGMIYAKNTFNLQDFEIQVDLSVHNKAASSFAKGQYRLFLLRDNPMKSAHEFAVGLDGVFDGLEIVIKENSARNKYAKEDKGAPPRAHEVEVTLRDEEFNDVYGHSKKKFGCEISFDDAGIDATVYVRAHKDKITLSFTDPKTRNEAKAPCVSIPLPDDYFTEDHDVYLFMAAQSGVNIPSSQIVHEIRFYDTNHLHDMEEVNTAADLKAFTGKHVDQLRKGRIQDQYTTESYNKQLIKHNHFYSKLVSDFISNQEMLLQHLHNLPHHEVLSNLTAVADHISSRFSLMNDQFEKYDKDVTKYMEFLKDLTDRRLNKRYEGALESNPFAMEQKEILGDLQSVQQSMVGYQQTVSANHLIEQIKRYDQKVRENDDELAKQDSALLQVLGSKNARDEFLDDEEAENIMTQQIRKILSKETKMREKEIKMHVKNGQLGMTSKVVDYIMYASIFVVLGFGYVAYNKIQEQKDSLVI